MDKIKKQKFSVVNIGKDSFLMIPLQKMKELVTKYKIFEEIWGSKDTIEKKSFFLVKRF